MYSKGYTPKLKGGELKCRVTSSSGMRETYWQCSICGKVHYIEKAHKIDSNNIYEKVYCTHCEDYTDQLWCGENILDFYELYNWNLDERFFIY